MRAHKFNWWNFKFSNDVNTVHVAAILKKLQQEEKVFKYLCTPWKRDLLRQWQQVVGGRATGGGAQKIWKCFQKRMTFQYFSPSDGCSNTFGGKCTFDPEHKQCLSVNLLSQGWKKLYKRHVKYGVENVIQDQKVS